MNGEPGSERIVRTFAFTIGLGGAAYGAVDSAEILHQSQLYETWWTVVSLGLMFGSTLALAAVAFRTSVRSVRHVASLLAVSYLVAAALTPFAIAQGTLTAQSTWQYRIAALGAVAAGLAWRAGPAIAYLFVASGAAALVNLWVLDDPGISAVGQDFARAVTTAGLFTWVALCADRAGTILDTETARAERAAAASAAVQARAAERDRFAALIHDGVLSTLLDASRGVAPAVLAKQASATLRQFDEFRAPPGQLDGGGAIARLREAVRHVNEGVEFHAHRHVGFDDLTMPIDAANTVAAAVMEAVRNSLRHAQVAGRQVRRTVDVTIGAGGLRVEVIDDGAGFDPSVVGNDRLGVAFSILGRMRQLPGGAAFLESAPGRGTKVTLVWGNSGAG